MNVGDELAPFRRTITREMGIRNAGPLHNFHTDLDEARALGFDDIVIAGPMFTCFYSEMFTRAFGEAWITSGKLDFRLLKPVLAGQTVAARAVVTRREDSELELEVWCEREEDGVKTSVGTASVRLA